MFLVPCLAALAVRPQDQNPADTCVDPGSRVQPASSRVRVEAQLRTDSVRIPRHICDLQDDAAVMAKLRCAAGLAAMDSKKYKQAATRFTEVNRRAHVMKANDAERRSSTCPGVV